MYKNDVYRVTRRDTKVTQISGAQRGSPTAILVLLHALPHNTPVPTVEESFTIMPTKQQLHPHSP